MKKTALKTAFMIFFICMPVSAAVSPIDFREMQEKAEAYKEAIEYYTYQCHYWKIAETESSLVWDTINEIGAMGLFQFTEGTLSDLGYNITTEAFRKDPNIFTPSGQFEVMDKLTKKNEKRLTWIIKVHSGEIVNGVMIDKLGILAAAHLAGVGGVCNYFNHGADAGDCNSTRISDYLIKFSNMKPKNTSLWEH